MRKYVSISFTIDTSFKKWVLTFGSINETLSDENPVAVTDRYSERYAHWLKFPAPGGPLGPGGPEGPAGPTGPCGPLSPCGPRSPFWPSTPSVPFLPGSPASPCWPGGPCAPAFPLGPSLPGAPGTPLDPLNPGEPIGPCNLLMLWIYKINSQVQPSVTQSAILFALTASWRHLWSIRELK